MRKQTCKGGPFWLATIKLAIMISGKLFISV